MKNYLVLVALAFSLTPVSPSRADHAVHCTTWLKITCGDRVRQTNFYGSSLLNHPIIQKVTAISNGEFQLEDGYWYKTDYIHPLEESLNGIKVGKEVRQTQFYDTSLFSHPSIQKVTAISNGEFQLEDGYWYETDYIHSLEDSLYGIRVGEEVRQTQFYDTGLGTHPSIQKVTAISDGEFQLADSHWYRTRYIHKVEKP